MPWTYLSQEEVKGLLSDQREEEDLEQPADTENSNAASGEMIQIPEKFADEKAITKEGVKSLEMVNRDITDNAPYV